MDDMIRLLEQQLASQEQDARQPRLAMEADEPAKTKTRERTKGAALQFKRCMGIAVLQPGLNPVQRQTRSVSA